MADSMNMMSVPVDRFIRFIKEQFEDGDLTPIIGIGKSGVGKTVSVYDLTKELGIGFAELRLVTMNEVDLLGIPDKTEHNTTTYASNDLLPRADRDGEKGILVLDEITSCSSTIRAAAYQLLDSKRALGNYKLPDGWMVVALGNGIDDGGVFSGMEMAFLSRARCLRVEPDLPSWKRWASKKDINDSVVAYLEFEPEYLHKMGEDEVASVFPCPRSWEALARMLTNREKKVSGGMLKPEDVDIYAASCVGVDVAYRFSAFYSNKAYAITPEDILSGRATTDQSKLSKITKEAMYLTLQSLSKSILALMREDTEKRGRGFDNEGNEVELGFYSDEIRVPIVNAFKWVIEVSDKVALDYFFTLAAFLRADVNCFSKLLLESRVDGNGNVVNLNVWHPGLEEFITQNGAVAV